MWWRQILRLGTGFCFTSKLVWWACTCVIWPVLDEGTSAIFQTHSMCLHTAWCSNPEVHNLNLQTMWHTCQNRTCIHTTCPQWSYKPVHVQCFQPNYYHVTNSYVNTLGVPWWWVCKLYSCGLWHHTVSQADTNVSDDHATSLHLQRWSPSGMELACGTVYLCLYPLLCVSVGSLCASGLTTQTSNPKDGSCYVPLKQWGHNPDQHNLKLRYVNTEVMVTNSEKFRRTGHSSQVQLRQATLFFVKCAIVALIYICVTLTVHIWWHCSWHIHTHLQWHKRVER
jgi:hypothetical protein